MRNTKKAANDDFIQFFERSVKSSKGEVSLWRAVMLQAIRDACMSPASKVKHIKERDIAIEWLITKDYDFYNICDNGALNIKVVEDIVDRILERVLADDLSTSTVRITTNG